MTTASWSSVVDHSSDAGFRAWGSEFNTKLAAVGMVQQSDTGQINWSTVTRPGSGNLMGGYEIWKTPSGGLCLKLEYGTATATTAPAFFVTVGTGSNGSGTITGQSTTRRLVTANGSPTSTAVAYQSYFCAKNNYLGIIWKSGAQGTTFSALLHLAMGPTVDATGADSNVGFYVLHGAASTSTTTVFTLQTVRTLSTAQTRNATNSYCVIPGQPSVSSDGTNNQVYLHWLDTPAIQPALYTGTIIASELSLGSTASIALVGTTPRTYISMGPGTSQHADAATTSGSTAIMLWE